MLGGDEQGIYRDQRRDITQGYQLAINRLHHSVDDGHLATVIFKVADLNLQMQTLGFIGGQLGYGSGIIHATIAGDNDL